MDPGTQSIHGTPTTTRKLKGIDMGMGTFVYWADHEEARVPVMLTLRMCDSRDAAIMKARSRWGEGTPFVTAEWASSHAAIVEGSILHHIVEGAIE